MMHRSVLKTALLVLVFLFGCYLSDFGEPETLDVPAESFDSVANIELVDTLPKRASSNQL